MDFKAFSHKTFYFYIRIGEFLGFISPIIDPFTKKITYGSKSYKIRIFLNIILTLYCFGTSIYPFNHARQVHISKLSLLDKFIGFITGFSFYLFFFSALFAIALKKDLIQKIMNNLFLLKHFCIAFGKFNVLKQKTLHDFFLKFLFDIGLAMSISVIILIRIVYSSTDSIDLVRYLLNVSNFFIISTTFYMILLFANYLIDIIYQRFEFLYENDHPFLYEVDCVSKLYGNIMEIIQETNSLFQFTLMCGYMSLFLGNIRAVSIDVII